MNARVPRGSRVRRRRVGAGTLAAGMALVSATACFSSDPDPMEPLPAECRQLALDAGVNPDAADVEVVGIRGFAFVPSEITVQTGTTVVWVNCEPSGTTGGDHTTTADDGESWGSPLLSRGEVFSRAFGLDEEGTYGYHCAPHPFMQGTVIVGARPIPGE